MTTFPSPVYTFIYPSPTSNSWDTPANWSPAGITIDPNHFSLTVDDSLLLNSTANGGLSYVSLLGQTSDDEQIDSLTINFAGATVAAFPTSPNFPGFDNVSFAGTIDLLAGTLNTNGMVISFGNTDNGGNRGTQPNAGTLLDDGLLIGGGIIDSSVNLIVGTGTIESTVDPLSGSTGMNIGAPIQGNITIKVDPGATLTLGNAVASTVMINDLGTSPLELDNVATFQGTISGLGVAEAAGDQAIINAGSVPSDVLAYLDLVSDGVIGTGNAQIPTLTSATYTPTVGDPTAGGVIMVFGVDGYTANIAVSGNYVGDTVAFVSDGGNNDTNGFKGYDVFFSQVCFLPGTRIQTPGGTTAIELLSAGDEVITVVDGQRVARPVKWIGYRKLTLDARAMAAGLAPVCIKRGAMAEGLPVRDLLVSPPHGMFLDGKLIPAKLLVNDMTIVRETAMTAVEYYHVELDKHAVIIAEGVETESYLDTGNRAFFGNAGLALILHPEFHVNAGLRCWETDACAPLAVSPAAVLPVWRHLADRALALGFVAPSYATTTEADIHLMADGRRIEAIAVKGQVYSFMVPAGVKSLGLASRSVVPNVLVRYLDDPRELGVAVRDISIRGVANVAVFAADHPVLVNGWHAPERADGALWRWTSGLGALPVGVIEGPVVVDVHVSETTTYLVDDVQTESRLAA